MRAVTIPSRARTHAWGGGPKSPGWGLSREGSHTGEQDHPREPAAAHETGFGASWLMAEDHPSTDRNSDRATATRGARKQPFYNRRRSRRNALEPL
jgi:hypothetical protein